MGVGGDLAQGAGAGRESCGSSGNTTHPRVRVTGFFLENTMVVLSDAITPQKSMVHPQQSMSTDLIRVGEHDGDVRIDRGGQWDGVISILNKPNLCPLCRP